MVFISYLSARRRYNATEGENWLTPMLKGGLWCLISVSHHHFLFLRCYALTLHQQKLLQRTSHQIQVHASLAVHRKVVINAIDAEKNKNSCTMNKIIHMSVAQSKTPYSMPPVRWFRPCHFPTPLHALYSILPVSAANFLKSYSTQYLSNNSRAKRRLSLLLLLVPSTNRLINSLALARSSRVK